jgi:hypothetical protein
MPVRQFFTTIPVVGVIIALTAGAASVAIIELIQEALQKTLSPTHLGMLFWPQFGGAVVSAVLFGVLFRTRLVATLAFAGMALIAGGGAVVTGVTGGGQALVVVGSGLLGLGVGASVSPALFIAGFSLASAQLQRVFALVELLRGTAAFMVAPLIVHMAMTVGQSPKQGVSIAIWVSLGLAAGGGLLALYVWILGRARLQRPDLERWMGGEGPAWDSPPLAAGVRGESGQPRRPPASAPRY